MGLLASLSTDRQKKEPFRLFYLNNNSNIQKTTRKQLYFEGFRK